MPRWARGEAEVEQLIARGELERVSGAAADGTPLLEQARKTAATAAGLVSSDPYSAYVLAYDAARFACIALLAQQGLRATTSGGHYAVEQSVRAQFGDGFRPFGILRRRRNELEYPHLPADTATSEEAEQAAGTAHGLITAAGRLLPQLAFFSQNQELGDHHRRNSGLVNPHFITDPQPFWMVFPGGFRDVVATDLGGYFLVARVVVPRLLAAGAGRVVNVTMNHATMNRKGSCPTGRCRGTVPDYGRRPRWQPGDAEPPTARGAALTGLIPEDLPEEMRSGLLRPQSWPSRSAGCAPQPRPESTTSGSLRASSRPGWPGAPADHYQEAVDIQPLP